MKILQLPKKILKKLLIKRLLRGEELENKAVWGNFIAVKTEFSDKFRMALKTYFKENGVKLKYEV